MADPVNSNGHSPEAPPCSPLRPLPGRGAHTRDPNPAAHTGAPVPSHDGQLAEVLRTLPRMLRDVASVIEKLEEIQLVRVAAAGDMEHMCEPVLSIPSPTTTRQMLTVKTLAKHLDVNPKTVRRWKAEGLLPEPVSIGGVVRWDPQAIKEWVQAGGLR